MNYQTKSTKVQAMQLEQDIKYQHATYQKGEWLVVENGYITFYSDEDFRDRFELALPKPAYRFDEVLGLGAPGSVKLLKDQGSYRDTCGYRLFD